MNPFAELNGVQVVSGFLAPWLLYALIFALHVLLPARRVEGYVRGEDGALLTYRLNGLLVFLSTLGLWAALGATDLLSYDWLYTHRWPSLLGAVALGLAFTFVVVLPAPPTGKPWLVDVFLGRHLNLQWFGARVDAKMFLYLFGATVLGLNLVSFASFHVQTHGPSPTVLLYVGLFAWFLIDYLTFERVHLYTYDLFAERVGFKLGWGCLAFYPYFYAVGLWAVADRPNPSVPNWWLALAAATFFLGWIFARGANMQKYVFKRDPDRVFLGLFRPKTVTDGERTLLCSGFWGLSRHINYLGEILMGTGLTLALGYPAEWLTWLYPIYYVALLVPRQFDDDRRCKAKYGALWDEYVDRVPRRIVPWVF